MKQQVQAALEAAGESALMYFGTRAQIVKACEEMSELITKLCKRLNQSPVTDTDIVDEVADVLIMANQMRRIYGEDAVDERIVFKLDRTMNFIRSRKVGEPILAGIAHENLNKGDACSYDPATGAIAPLKAEEVSHE